MRAPSLLRMLCVGCLAVAGVLAQDQAAPPPPAAGGAPGAPGAGPGAPAGPGGPGGGPASFDPAQMQQRFMAYIQETLGAKADEWQVIEPRVKAVFEKQRASRELQFGRGMFRGPQGGQREQPGEIAAVEKAAKSGDAAATKTALDALRKARTEREAEVTKARQSLREVVSVTQEAQLVLLGILD